MSSSSSWRWGTTHIQLTRRREPHATGDPLAATSDRGHAEIHKQPMTSECNASVTQELDASRLVAQGSWPRENWREGPWPGGGPRYIFLGQESWGLSHEPWAMSLGSCTINKRLINFSKGIPELPHISSRKNICGISEKNNQELLCWSWTKRGVLGVRYGS